MKIGLLIIDMQQSFLEGQVEQRSIDSACEYINHVADILRANNQVVIHIKDIEGADHPNNPAIDFISEIQMGPGDITVNKQYSNAFWQTELETMLNEKQVELVIISGFSAEHCVLFTYNGAIERGYNTAVLQGGILSTRPDAIQNTYRDRHIVSYPVIELIAASIAHPSIKA
ncbi:isochorismatase family protein [Neobacillus mesonae]|nr:isochorismatase family protein [Neobacillus mesonae]